MTNLERHLPNITPRIMTDLVMECVHNEYLDCDFCGNNICPLNPECLWCGTVGGKDGKPCSEAIYDWFCREEDDVLLW